MTSDVDQVEKACTHLANTDQPVTFTAVADHARLSRATLYRNPNLRAIIEEHRTRQRDARTLTGLTTEIAHLRTAVEALAVTVKRHEEHLRRINQKPK
jgi:nicotinamidase-related amidase